MNNPYSYSQHFSNPAQDNSAYAEAMSSIGSKAFLDDCQRAQSAIKQWPGYESTDLLSLTDIAEKAKVSKIYYKDESSRLGLGSFKALGGSYAIQSLVANHKEKSAQPLIVCTATDGNHGRSVAWGAQLLGVECHIFIHANVSQSREQSMAELGAIIHRVDGNYDVSVAACIEMSEAHQWQIVSDTSWPGYDEIPKQVMAGYSVMADEIIQQLGNERPTHIFIQAGCGGLAGAMIAYFWQHWGRSLPTIIIVESDLSDCVYQSLVNNQIKLVDIIDETLMAGLSCGEVSLLAWPLLQKAVGHVITFNDDGVVPMMRWLAKPDNQSRRAIEAGECSASGLMGLMAIQNDPKLAAEMGIDEQSIILVLGTEGATDPDFYETVIG